MIFRLSGTPGQQETNSRRKRHVKAMPCLCRLRWLFVSCCPDVPGSLNIISYETAHKRNHLEIRETSFPLTGWKRNGCRSPRQVFQPLRLGHMAHHRSRTRRRRLALVRLLSYPRMGVGYLMLSELAYLSLPFGLTIERDIYTARKYVRDFLPQDE